MGIGSIIRKAILIGKGDKVEAAKLIVTQLPSLLKAAKSKLDDIQGITKTARVAFDQKAFRPVQDFWQTEGFRMYAYGAKVGRKGGPYSAFTPEYLAQIGMGGPATTADKLMYARLFAERKGAAATRAMLWPSNLSPTGRFTRSAILGGFSQATGQFSNRLITAVPGAIINVGWAKNIPSRVATSETTAPRTLYNIFKQRAVEKEFGAPEVLGDIAGRAAFVAGATAVAEVRGQRTSDEPSIRVTAHKELALIRQQGHTRISLRQIGTKTTPSGRGSVQVRGYRRSDGTYVRPHSRRS